MIGVGVELIAVVLGVSSDGRRLRGEHWRGAERRPRRLAASCLRVLLLEKTTTLRSTVVRLRVSRENEAGSSTTATNRLDKFTLARKVDG